MTDRPWDEDDLDPSIIIEWFSPFPEMIFYTPVSSFLDPFIIDFLQDFNIMIYYYKNDLSGSDFRSPIGPSLQHPRRRYHPSLI